jgi:translation initiation factor 1
LAGTRDSRPVYSTDGGRLCPQCQRQLVKCVCGTARPLAAGDGVVRIRRETKGRGGKAVTVIAGIPEHPDTLKTLCKQLKKRCGVGGAVKGDTIEIQGEQRAVCQEHLVKMGYQVKLSGG